MNRLPAFVVLSLLSLIAVPRAIAQQGPPRPSPELRKLEPIVGHWRGEGTALVDPMASPMKWTCVSANRWVLGGYWLESDIEISFEGMGSMRTREYLGWDQENGRFVKVSVSNTGEVSLSTGGFKDDRTLFFFDPIRRGEAPFSVYVSRSITRLRDDESSFEVAFLTRDGVIAKGVQGVLRRVDSAAPSPIESAQAMAPESPEMARLVKMVGEYDVEGRMQMMPGTEAVKVTGHDSLRSWFQGRILQFESRGTAEGMPGAYEAVGFYGWNAAERCYDFAMVSSMGEVGLMKASFAEDGTFVSTWNGTMMGTPVTSHSALRVGDDGKPTRLVSWSLLGSSKPYESFRAEYTTAK
ncbi:MAG: hypothetical protein Fur0037_20530 [Planctomycetota bacterium]